MISVTEDRQMLGYELLDSFPDIFHFVTTRNGGYSEGEYASFNCTDYTGDREETVKKNRELLCSLLPQQPAELIIPRQTHGTAIRIIDEFYVKASCEEKRKLTDGVDSLITRLPGYCLCVSTADCIPVMIYDKCRKAVAIVHAGWRGTVNEIVVRTLEKMKEEFGSESKDLIACIGPGISLENFEVGEEVYRIFREAGFNMPLISAKDPIKDKWHIDLWEANRIQLSEWGIAPEHIEIANICTYRHNEMFFSARRSGINSGRILSGILLLRAE